MEESYKEMMKLDNQLCFPLYACARHVVNLYTPFLKPLGLTYTQYIVFLVLWEQEEVTIGELCKKLMLDNGTLSPLIKKMESDGYVRRERKKEDDRVVIVTLTDKGRALQEEAKDIPTKIACCVDLPVEESKELYIILYELLNKINKGEKTDGTK